MKKKLTINEKCQTKIINSKKERKEKIEEIIDSITRCFDKENVVYVKLDFVRIFKEEKKIEPLSNISGFSYEGQYIYSISPSFNPDVLSKFKIENWQYLIDFFKAQDVEIICYLYSDSCKASDYSLKFFPKCLLKEEKFFNEYNSKQDENLAQKLVDCFQSPNFPFKLYFK